jgi:hypothetical protein
MSHDEIVSSSAHRIETERPNTEESEAQNGTTEISF